jgi:hypothetical protein
VKAEANVTVAIRTEIIPMAFAVLARSFDIFSWSFSPIYFSRKRSERLPPGGAPTNSNVLDITTLGFCRKYSQLLDYALK